MSTATRGSASRRVACAEDPNAGSNELLLSQSAVAWTTTSSCSLCTGTQRARRSHQSAKERTQRSGARDVDLLAQSHTDETQQI